MPYSQLAANLPAFYTALGSSYGAATPADSEAQNILAASQRQTRQFLYDFLSAVFGTGATPVLQVAVANALVTNAMLAANAVVDANVASGAAIAESKLALAYTTTALNSLISGLTTLLGSTCTTSGATVSTSNKIFTTGDATYALIATLNTLLTSTGISNANVAAAAAIALTKLAGASNGNIVYGSGGVWTSTPLAGLIPATFGTTLLREQLTGATGAGTSGATPTTSVSRGITSNVGWTAVDPAGNLSGSLGSDGRITLKAGTYVIEASAPAYAVGSHQLQLAWWLATVLQTIIVGTSEIAPTGVQTRSFVQGIITVALNDYFYLPHYAANSVANGLGFPFGTGVQTYAQVSIRRIA